MEMSLQGSEFMVIIEETETDCLFICLDIFGIDNVVNESIDFENNAENIITNIIGIINEFGYTELMNKPKSNQSNSKSLYFTFCDENEFNTEEVELIVRMRVSDHNLPRWKNNKNEQDAINRQLNDLKAFAHDNKFLNKNLNVEEEIPVEYIYVKYENKWYSNIEEVYDKVRKKLQDFKNKH